MRSWLVQKLPKDKETVEWARWDGLIELLDRVDSAIRANPVMVDLEGLWAVANAVRHGNGRSAEKLLQTNPQFWDQTRTRTGTKNDLVGSMRLEDSHLDHYAKAAMRFWHLAGASPLV